MPNRPYKRQTNLSMPRIQMRLLLWILGACTAVSIYHLSAQELLLADTVKWGNYRISPRLFVDLGFAVFLILYIMLYIAWTNRFLGPVVHMHRIIRILGRASSHSHIDFVRLRKNDYFQEIAEDLNKVVHQVNADKAAQPNSETQKN